MDRRTGTFGLGRGGAATFLPQKNYTIPECASVEIGIQMHLNCSKNNHVHNTRVTKL